MTLSPPPTLAEMRLAAELVSRARGGAGQAGDVVDHNSVTRVVQDLRDGRAFVAVRDTAQANELRKVFPRAPVVIRGGELYPRLVEKLVREREPSPCARCALFEEAENTQEAEVLDRATADRATTLHTFQGACQARWSCDRCRMVWSEAELLENGGVCTSVQCRGPAPMFSGVFIGRLV